jgi:hypothetical protein
LAVNTGPDVGAFTRGLASGKRGSYFEIDPQEYEISLARTQASLPEERLLPFEPTALESTEDKPAPASAPQETDEQREARMQADMDAQEKRQAQILGGGVGLGISGTKAVGAGAGAALQGAATRVGQGFRAGMQGGVPTPPVTTPVTAPVQGGLSALDPNANQATRILQGTTGDEGTTGRARQQGYNEQTAQQAAQRKETERLLAQLRQTGAVADDAPAFFSKQPGMTSTPSGVVYPRSEPAPTLGPRGPQGQVGFAKPPTPPAPPPPSMLSRTMGGLDTVTNMFKGMMRPAASAAATASRYVMPPLALASAAGEGVNIAQQARKPEGQRDLTSMGLSGLNILGSGMSMFPATAPVGVPMMLGTAAAQTYRDNPNVQEYIKRKMQGLANTPLLDEMTAPRP